jgi:hypothetical protein
VVFDSKTFYFSKEKEKELVHNKRKQQLTREKEGRKKTTYIYIR